MRLDPHDSEPMAQAAFEQSFDAHRPDALGEFAEGVNAASLVVFIEPPTPEWGSGFFFFLAGSRKALDPSRRQSPNALAQALAASARAALYDAGFGAPANPMNDYPSATFLLSQDIACSQIALSAPASMSRDEAVVSAQRAASDRARGLFGPLMALSRAALPELRRHRAFDALANEAIGRLRQALQSDPDSRGARPGCP